MPIFVDGFDHYTTDVQARRKWDAWDLISVQTTGGRNNSGYIRMNTGLSSPRKHFAATNHVILQYGVRANYTGQIGALTLCNLTSPLGGPHSRLELLDDGSIRYLRGGSGGTQLAITAGGTVSGGVWHYLEIEQTLSTGGASTGSLQVKLNGVILPELNLSGINNNDDLVEFPTQAALIGAAGSSPLLDADDLVLVTGSEAAPFNTLFGDWAVRTLYPNGAGGVTQFTPTPAVANYLNVDETYPDDDTTYVESATVGQIDRYAFTDLPATVTAVLGVMRTPTVRKSDAGTRQFQSNVHRAGTSATGPTLTATSAYAAGLQTMFRFDPITGIAWTPAQVNAAEAGNEVIT